MPMFRIRAVAKPPPASGLPTHGVPRRGLHTWPETCPYYRRAGLLFTIDVVGGIGREIEADVDEQQLAALRADPRIEVLSAVEVPA